LTPNEANGGDIVLAPPVHYGFNEHNMDFPGTVSIDPQNFMNYVFDIARSFATMGFQYMLIANGHGSNHILLEVVARLATVPTSLKCASFSYWQLAPEAVDRLRESEFPGGMSHACEFETSVYMHLDPEHVQHDHIQREVWHSGSDLIWTDLLASSPVRFVDWWSARSKTGTNGDATVATPEKGREFVETAAGNILQLARDFRQAEFGHRESFQPAAETRRDSAVGQVCTGGTR
jgi:creatinine amidohydrolase